MAQLGELAWRLIVINELMAMGEQGGGRSGDSASLQLGITIYAPAGARI